MTKGLWALLLKALIERDSCVFNGFEEPPFFYLSRNTGSGIEPTNQNFVQFKVKPFSGSALDVAQLEDQLPVICIGNISIEGKK